MAAPHTLQLPAPQSRLDVVLVPREKGGKAGPAAVGEEPQGEASVTWRWGHSLLVPL